MDVQKQGVLDQVRQSHTQGRKIADILRVLGVKSSTYYRWKSESEREIEKPVLHPSDRITSRSLTKSERNLILDTKERDPELRHRQIQGEMIERGWVIEALGEMKPDHATQAQIFAILWQKKNTRAHSPLQHKTMEQVSRGLGAVDESGIVEADKLTNTNTVGVTRLPEALRPTPHLLDHYLLNEMFRELFPFGDSSPYQHYLRLVTRYGLVRLMLAALCNGAERLPTPGELINVVHVFSRRYQHDQHFASHVNTALKNSGWDKLEMGYRFLRA